MLVEDVGIPLMESSVITDGTAADARVFAPFGVFWLA